MNILPKKRWHVRTKENIARVRKDEAEAAEKEKQERLRIENADREARLSVLKQQSKIRLEEYGVVAPAEQEPAETVPATVDTVAEPSGHINLFTDFDHFVKTTNKEHDQEVKEKKEEYEKKIGYLTYLGQDTNEALNKKNWYEVAPGSSRFTRSEEIKVTYDKLVLKDPDGKPKAKRLDVKNGEVSWKAKQQLDPINAFKKYCHGITTTPKPVESTKPKDYTPIIVEPKSKHKSKKKKHKKERIDDEDKAKKLQKLREARLKREQQERRRTEMFLTGLNKPAAEIVASPSASVVMVKPKYNSQFNPELARQNYR